MKTISLIMALANLPGLNAIVPQLAPPPDAPPATSSVVCPTGQPAKITVTPFFDPPKIDFGKSTAELDAITGGEVTPMQPGQTRSGLTASEQTFNLQIAQDLVSLPDGQICGSVTRVDARFGMVDNALYVASELNQDSCLHAEVLAHEQRHIETLKAILAEFTPQMERALKQAASELTAVRGPNADAVKATIQQSLLKAAAVVQTATNDETIRRQSAIDSPEEYARLHQVCGGRLSQVISHKP